MKKKQLLFMVRESINGGVVVMLVSALLLLTVVVGATALVRNQGKSHPTPDEYGALEEQIDVHLRSIDRIQSIERESIDWEQLIADRATPLQEPMAEEVLEEPIEVLEEVVGVEAKLTLDGILWNNQLPMALVNNQVVGTGDKVAGCKVVSIVKDVVTFETEDGIIRTCSLYEDLDVADDEEAEAK